MGIGGRYLVISIIVGITFLAIDLIDNVYAVDYVLTVSVPTSCTGPPLSGTWVSPTCTLSDSFTLDAGDTLTISNGITLVFSTDTNLINLGNITNSGTIVIDGTNDFDGQVRNEDNAFFTNLGKISITGDNDQSGRLINKDAASFTNSGTIAIVGTAENSGWFLNNDDSSFINSGTITIDGTSNNSGQFRNEDGASLTNFGIIILTGVNAGIGDVSGLIRNLSVITNSGSISTNFDIDNFGLIDDECGEIIFVTLNGNPIEEEYILNCIVGTSIGYEDPTIGKSHHGKQMVENGICIDIKCWTVTADYYQDFKLVEMLSDSTHTITTTIFCQHGVNKCNYVAFGVSPYGTNINDSVWKIILQKDHRDNWTMRVIDPDDYLGEVTSTTQIVNDARHLLASATIEFKKPTPGMILNIEVRDTERGYRVFKFNDGISIVDAYAYPSIETFYEPPLEIEPLCLNENSNKRYTCAFDKVRDWTIKNAEATLNRFNK